MIVLICVIILGLGAAGVIEGLALIVWSLFEMLRQLISGDPTNEE